MEKKLENQKRGDIARLASQIAEHQARIQVIASNWWMLIVSALDATEKQYLATLAKGLAGIEFIANDPTSLKKLTKLCAKLAAIRAAGWMAAEKQITKESAKLAENEMHWAKRISRELGAGITPDDIKAAKIKTVNDIKDIENIEPSPMKNLTTKQIKKVVDNGLAEGQTTKEWFKKLSDEEAARVEAAVKQGVADGKTIEDLSAEIGGTAKNDHKDGILERSRIDSQRMARTVTNAVANNAKEEFYRENSDVLVGVEILATLDGRTCPVCAGLDRTRYGFDEPHPTLPIHHNCRCVLLPVTPLTDLVEESRPMAKADFMAEAKRKYEEKYPNKKFDDLAESTRKKYYHEAMREYEARTGESAYTQVPGSVSFREYFEKHMTEAQRRDWLGPRRYELWKRGNLPLDKFIPPYPNKQLTVDALKELDKKSFGN
jgi:SPP1 gp7 family putative phage head morphogenesis protein